MLKVGPGVMGGHMAANMTKKRFPPTVNDINVETSDIVVTMLPEPRRLEQVVPGPDGIGAMLGGNAAAKSRKTA